ncbi:DUF4145 domain-containing protein [Vibrio crassostreae]|nr:DUF4145 domain-containing protein [Vibrio crassostreae]CAK2337882.1 DUF4145 domain-containing protein [Vibrio crassostreae]CAK2507274.1 DUF4145 domain-containing protein [Vibrio crassostreae]CAK2898708.1 DUF4145 domain-containing protein [Vibrio crassostreae]
MNEVDFKDLLLNKSDTESVIYTHIHIEHLVVNFLESSLPEPSYLKPMRLDYFSSVHLALAFGIASELKAPLMSLGKMRNDFAHNLGQSIDKNRINNFYDSFSPEHRQKIHKLAHDLGVFGLDEGIRWKDMEPKNKFSLCCISLFYFVRFAILEKSHRQKLSQMGFHAMREKIDSSS